MFLEAARRGQGPFWESDDAFFSLSFEPRPSFPYTASMENPARSRIWLCPPLLALRRRRHVSWHVTHYCAWGKAFKKPTAFLAVRLNLHRLDAAVCIGAKRGTWFLQVPWQHPHSSLWSR